MSGQSDEVKNEAGTCGPGCNCGSGFTSCGHSRGRVLHHNG
jgi:hypothetical protein